MTTKYFRYISILVLSLSATGLFYYYNLVRIQSAAVIQLMAFFPYNIHDLEFNGHSINRCGIYPTKFFADSMVQAELSEKLVAAELSDKIFKKALGDFEEQIWTKQISPFEFYNGRLAVPDNYAAEFYKSNREYISTFAIVLKQTQWSIAITRYGKVVSDTVSLDVRATLEALKKLESLFATPGKVVIENRTFDLKELTRVELFIMLEHVMLLRASVERNYWGILEGPVERWAGKLLVVEREEFMRRKND